MQSPCQCHAPRHLQNLLATNELTLQFLTPLRLEEHGSPYKMPDFAVLYRIDELNRQFAGQERRDPANVVHLHTFSDQVS